MPTVKTHVSRILGKLNVQSRARAATAARDLHLLQITPIREKYSTPRDLSIPKPNALVYLCSIT
ncbi:MAG: LuxR C-terminal-related transcriptional regulator [Chloroflexota bacterium]